MKRVIAIICLFSLISCADFDNERCLETVQAKYPDALEIKQAPEQAFGFMVNTGKEIRYVRIMGSYDKITSDTLYMRIKSPD